MLKEMKEMKEEMREMKVDLRIIKEEKVKYYEMWRDFWRKLNSELVQ